MRVQVTMGVGGQVGECIPKYRGDTAGALSGLGESEQLSLKAGFILAILLFSPVTPDLPYYCLWIIFYRGRCLGMVGRR